MSDGTHTHWAPAGVPQEKSPTGQDFYVQTGVRNAENIRKFTLDGLFRELCPVWKQGASGGPSLYPSEVGPQ